MVGPPHVPTLFGVFLWPKTVRCFFGCFISFAKPKQHTAIKDDSPKPKTQNQKKQKKQNQKKQKKQKHHYFRTLPFVYISKLFWKSSEIMVFLVLFFWFFWFWFFCCFGLGFFGFRRRPYQVRRRFEAHWLPNGQLNEPLRVPYSSLVLFSGDSYLHSSRDS